MSSTRSRSSRWRLPNTLPICSTTWSPAPESVISELGLPYRIIEICTGDLGQSHHRSFDIEVYAPGAGAWLEVSSISWFSDYQAARQHPVPAGRRRRQTPEGHRVRAHVERIGTRSAQGVAAIVENFRSADGSITVPEVLRPYIRGIERIERA